MNWKNVRLIFHREVRDQVRDRRTLFMVVILPLLLYPGLAIGMVQVSLLFREQPRTVVLLGSANLPQKPPLLDPKDGSRFDAEWFTVPTDADKLQVIGDAGSRPDSDAALAKRDADLLDDARALRPLAEQLEQLQQSARKGDDAEQATRLAEQIRSAKDQLAERFSATKSRSSSSCPPGSKTASQRPTARWRPKHGSETMPSAPRRRWDSLSSKTARTRSRSLPTRASSRC